MGDILPSLLSLSATGALTGCLFIYVSAKLAMIERATVLRSLAAAAGSSLATWFAAGLLAHVPLLASCSGFILGAGISFVFIRYVLDTTVAKAFPVWVFYLLAQFVALFVAGVTFAGKLLHYLTPPSTPF